MQTDVIFRRRRNAGEVIAVFPGIPSGNNWAGACQAYENGKIIPCPVTICEHTRAAKPQEYAPLLVELLDRGYRINLTPRFLSRHLTQRKQAVEALIDSDFDGMLPPIQPRNFKKRSKNHENAQ